MKRFIIDGPGRIGGIRRGDLRGDVLGALYSYAEINGIAVPGHTMCKDAWAERALAWGLIDTGAAGAYAGRLNACLGSLAANDDATFEGIYEAICRLRRETFGQAIVDEATRRAAREADTAPHGMDIDQSPMGWQMLENSRSALFALADARLYPLMRAHMARARAAGKAVYVAHADDEGALLPGRAAMETLADGAALAELADAGEIDGDDALGQAIDAGEACLFWYGETGLSRCRFMRIPTMVWCEPESITARALAGQFTRKGLCAVYVPAGFDILPFVPMVRRTLANYRHFAWLCAAQGESVYRMPAEELYRRWPEMFFSIYEETEPGLPEGVVWPKGEAEEGDWYADFCARRDSAIRAWLDGTPGLRSLSGWFELDSLARKKAPWSATGEAKGILVHGAVAEKVSGAEVRLAEGAPISPRILLQTGENPPARQLISNYLFFLTPRLAELYNRLRANRPREQSAMRGGHLDYMLYTDAAGRRVETFPLYQKACMGMMDDGLFCFFHFRLRGGELTINEQTVVWKECDVDPSEPGDIAVYTPYLSRADEGANRFEYAKAVGEGRVNFVLNQTEFSCARDGDVVLPGTGVVISFERKRGLALAKACGFGMAENGYFIWKEAPRFSVRLENPAEIDEAIWRRMRWAYGGGLTLIQSGESFFKRGEDASEKLAREGWTSPLSAQTQESDIAALARHPRTAVGLTKTGALFMLVFSGRSSVSAGADYVEMCEIAKKLVPDACEMMNVDGGGSAVMGIAAGRRFVEFSWPSTSFDSLAGMVRPVNSLLSLSISPNELKLH